MDSNVVSADTTLPLVYYELTLPTISYLVLKSDINAIGPESSRWSVHIELIVQSDKDIT